MSDILSYEENSFRLLSDPPKIKRKKKENLNLVNVSISKNKNTNSSKDVTLRDALNGYPQNLCSSELSKRKYVTNKDRTILNDSTIDRSKSRLIHKLSYLDKIKDPNGIVQTLSMIPTIREKPQGRLLTNNLPSR